MKTYIQLFWNLLILAFLLFIGYFAWESYGLHGKLKDLRDAPKATVGSDKRLQKTVDELEQRLQTHADFVFESRVNPLDISRVIISKNIMMDEKNFLATLEKKPRLSCIVQGETPRAIIRLKNQNHVVSAGDSFDGYQVAEITPESVRITRGGRPLTLKVEGASKDLAKRLSEMNYDF